MTSGREFRWLAALPTVLLLLSCTAVGQQAPAMKILETVTLPEQLPLAVFEPMKCGMAGHIYVRFANAEGGAVNVISPDGKHVSWARLDVVPDLQDGVLADFAPGPNGQTFLLIFRERKQDAVKYYVSKLDETGNYVSTAKLETGTDFVATQLAVFPTTGDFVVAGFQNRASKTAAALFSSGGQMLRGVSLPEDINSKMVEKHAHTDVGPKTLSWRDIVSVSSLQASDDGNIYLMRGTSSGPVYAISPAGVVRRIKLAPPNPQAMLLSVKVAEGTIVAEYKVPRAVGSKYEGPEFVLSLFDIRTGHLVERYDARGRELGVGMACYHDGSFSFLAKGKGEGWDIELSRAVFPTRTVPLSRR